LPVTRTSISKAAPAFQAAAVAPGPAPRPAADTSRRDESVHILRGIAALIVCLAHITTAGTLRLPPTLVAAVGHADFGVAVFFMISGFVVPWSLLGRGYSIGHFPRFLARRLVRLDPPYFAAIGLGLIVLWIKALYMLEPFPRASHIALHFGYLSGLADTVWIVPVFWTLAIEFQFYLLVGLSFPLLERIVRRSLGDKVATFGWGIVLAVLSDWCLRYAVAVPVPGGSPSVWLYYAPYFALGLAVFAARAGAVHWSLPAWLGTLMSFHSWPVLSVWIPVTVIATLVAARPVARFGEGPHWSALRGLGTISYSLYLTHAIVVGKLSYVYSLTHPDDPASGGLALAFASADLVVALVCAAAFYWMIERPAVRWSRRIAV
jgi:peptidoglycan/LPS O-acetylase OafA/YrhL